MKTPAEFVVEDVEQRDVQDIKQRVVARRRPLPQT